MSRFVAECSSNKNAYGSADVMKTRLKVNSLLDREPIIRKKNSILFSNNSLKNTSTFCLLSFQYDLFKTKKNDKYDVEHIFEPTYFRIARFLTAKLRVSLRDSFVEKESVRLSTQNKHC